MNCLTLLATRGDQPAWNSRANSNGHKAIPLASPEIVASIPMISQLVSQFGIDVNAVIKPDPAVVGDLAQRTYNTFHIPQAAGSPYIPAQDDFVRPHGIQSVLGFGGVLSSGELFAIIMFSKTAIPDATAHAFAAVASGAKEAVLPFVGGKVFA